VVLATFGSLGDLHPFVALAKGLQSRGHEPIIATSEYHRELLERHRIGFHPVRPDLLDLAEQPEMFRVLMDRNRGTAAVIKQLFMPHLRDSFDDLLGAVAGADLLVTHTIAFAGPLVAELTGVAWVSAVLAPMAFLSKYDPPVPPQAAWLRHLHPLGPRFFGPLLWTARRALRSWSRPVRRLRQELGLPPGGDPLFEGANSPDCVLALFSAALGQPQPDWPRQTIQAGFAFFDDANATGMSAELIRFFDAGPAPIVFTLGSSAVMDAGNFYHESLAAARLLGRRAVLLVGIDPRNRPPDLADDVLAIDYAPFSELFPRAAAVVHQGGVGTTGQALRSGRPMLVVPWAHDQYDNAERVRRLGVAQMLEKTRYRAATVAAALSQLFDDPKYVARSRQVGEQVQAEDGVAAAVEAMLRHVDTRQPAEKTPARTTNQTN
ncbi:MAG TPA: glycosyltransferase, partial [Pirellulales bacterium]|nr:glycosyltransferase [Pirellulales bacterium]